MAMNRSVAKFSPEKDQSEGLIDFREKQGSISLPAYFGSSGGDSSTCHFFEHQSRFFLIWVSGPGLDEAGAEHLHD
jgi:hypothetical protein